jgi:hypothetical protein
MMFPNDTLLQTEILTLQANAFTGTISSDIGQLSKLEQFDLVLSNVHGSIPTEVGMCTGLQTLHITGNNALIGTVGLFVCLIVGGCHLTPRCPVGPFVLTSHLLVFVGPNVDHCYTQIPSELGNLPNLRTFSSFSFPACQSNHPAIANMCSPSHALCYARTHFGSL